MRADRSGHPEQKLHEVRVVDVEVDRGAAGPLQVGGCPPRRARDDPLEVGGEHWAVLGVGDELFDEPEFWKVPQDVGHHKLPLVLLGRGHNSVRVVQGYGNGFFQ